MDPAKWSVILNAISIAVVAVSAWLLSRQISKQHEWNRKRAAHDLVFEALTELRRLREQLESKIDIYNEAQTYATISGTLSKEDHVLLDAILNYLESMCITVHNAVVDEDLMYNVFGGILIAYRRWADPYIRHERAKSAFLWIGIEPYVDAWRRRMNDTLYSVSGQRKAPL